MRETNAYTECFQRVREARTAYPVNTEELHRIRDHYGYDLYIECLQEVLKIQSFANECGFSFAQAKRALYEIENDIDTESIFEALRS